MKKTRAAWVVGIIAAAVILPPLTLPLFFPWSEINCTHQEINIKTGQARFTRYIWFMKVSERVEDTALSLALGGDVVDVVDLEPWRIGGTYSPGVNRSPQYGFTLGLLEIETLRKFDEIIQLTSVPKREIATTILTMWQRDGNCRSAEKYLTGIIERGFEIHEHTP